MAGAQAVEEGLAGRSGKVSQQDRLVALAVEGICLQNEVRSEQGSHIYTGIFLVLASRICAHSPARMLCSHPLTSQPVTMCDHLRMFSSQINEGSQACFPCLLSMPAYAQARQWCLQRSTAVTRCIASFNRFGCLQSLAAVTNACLMCTFTLALLATQQR